MKPSKLDLDLNQSSNKLKMLKENNQHRTIIEIPDITYSIILSNVVFPK